MLDRDLLALRPEDIHQLAGVTGVGWTVSLLGYLVTLLRYGTDQTALLGAEPRVLLYLGCLLFVTTLALDRFRTPLSTH